MSFFPKRRASILNHVEVPQGGLDRRLHRRWDLRRFHTLWQRSALASLGDDAMLPLDLGDVPGSRF